VDLQPSERDQILCLSPDLACEQTKTLTESDITEGVAIDVVVAIEAIFIVLPI